MATQHGILLRRQDPPPLLIGFRDGKRFVLHRFGDDNPDVRSPADIADMMTAMFASADFDLDAYLARIGFTGPAVPTLDTVARLVACHTQAIPFENLDPLAGRTVRLDIASLQAKLVAGRRGGYCYEHNLLAGHALAALGLRVTGLAARVRWNIPPAIVTPRTHMLLQVEIGSSPYLVDVGFGGLTLTGVLALEPDIEQETPHERFRLTRDGGDFLVEALVGGSWRPLYRFDLQPQVLADYELASWYLCNNPSSHFTNTLMAARSEPGCRLALRNAEFAVHVLSGLSERRVLRSAAEIRQTLETAFLTRVPEEPSIDAAFERLAAAQPAAV